MSKETPEVDYILQELANIAALLNGGQLATASGRLSMLQATLKAAHGHYESSGDEPEKRAIRPNILVRHRMTGKCFEVMNIMESEQLALVCLPEGHHDFTHTFPISDLEPLSELMRVIKGGRYEALAKVEKPQKK